MDERFRDDAACREYIRRLRWPQGFTCTTTPKSDSFLVLDVNPSRAGWVWMPTTNLIKGMRTFDTVENRGYILIRSP